MRPSMLLEGGLITSVFGIGKMFGPAEASLIKDLVLRDLFLLFFWSREN